MNAEQIRINRKTLDQCKQHKFDEFPELYIGVRFKCANCGGQILATEAYQYALGFEAAGGNPNEVMAGFR